MEKTTQKRRRFIPNMLMILVICNYIGKSLYVIVKHFSQPQAVQSSSTPWYMSILVSGAVIAAGLLLWRVIVAILNKLGK